MQCLFSFECILLAYYPKRLVNSGQTNDQFVDSFANTFMKIL